MWLPAGAQRAQRQQRVARAHSECQPRLALSPGTRGSLSALL